jgi:HEXXH motif-containing protein
MSERTTLKPHTLTREQFTALARGRGADADAIAVLVDSQRSKHLLLLAKVAEMARLGDRAEDRLALAGFELLAHVQRQHKTAADEVIGYPSVGAWSLHTIRQAGTMPGARPRGRAAGAPPAAARAGMDAEIEVPVVNGTVLLPSLGAADAAGDTAVVATKAAEIRSGGRRVEMRSGAPGWQDLRRVAAGSLSVLVDDLDPFRMPATDGEPTGRLTSAQVAELRATLGAAWPLLSPARAAEIAAIVRVIVPYQAPDSGLVSTSSPQAFGTVAMSRQPDPYTCAETLVHETQHLKLCALLDLVTLTRPDDGQEYYAPWRADPRPASGLLQGAYAFLGVSGFWREQSQRAPEPTVRQRAQVEFARWRDGAAQVVETLRGSGQLTERGQAFAGEMAVVLDSWRREPVPRDAVAAAQGMAERHMAKWRADNALGLRRLRWRAGRSEGRAAHPSLPPRRRGSLAPGFRHTTAGRRPSAIRRTRGRPSRCDRLPGWPRTRACADENRQAACPVAARYPRRFGVHPRETRAPRDRWLGSWLPSA